MVTIDDQIHSKRQELEALKRITSLTDAMKLQLDGLAGQVFQMQSNAETVSEVMKNWNSIMRSISQAGLSLLQYAEGDYEVGVWAPEEKEEGQAEDQQTEAPLPETLVRIRVDEEDNA